MAAISPPAIVDGDDSLSGRLCTPGMRWVAHFLVSFFSTNFLLFFKINIILDYSRTFFNPKIKEIDQLKSAGATGFVIGCLDASGAIDYAMTRALIGHIRESTNQNHYPITFHRAFDIARFDDLSSTLAQLAELGCDWLLTSGRAKSVTLGLINFF